MARTPVVLMLIACAACGRVGFDPASGDGSLSAGSPAAIYANAVTADRPIAYFHFDEAGGTVASSSVGSMTGQYQGSFVFGAPSRIAGSRAITFDGATTRIELGDQLRFGGSVPYSIELWMRPTALTTTRFLIDRVTTATPVEGYTLYMGDGFLLHARTVAGAETSYVSAKPPQIGAWMYVVMTYDGAVPRAYSDGALIQENGGGVSTIMSGPGNFVIGDSSPGQFFKLEGDLDELAIYDVALSPAQVAAHYAAAQ